MGRRLMRGKTREHNQNWNVKMMIKSGDMHNAGHHDYELLDRLSDIQQRLKGTTSSTNDGGAIPGIANHRRTPRDASVVARTPGKSCQRARPKRSGAARTGSLSPRR